LESPRFTPCLINRVILGIDLSGPANAQGTALAWFGDQGDRLAFAGYRLGAIDAEILELSHELASTDPLAIGIDAPLSYGVPSGSRPSDKALREKVVELGGKPGAVMAPTAPRMAYLTLRGVALTRMFAAVQGAHTISIVEIHPGAAFLLRGAPVADVHGLKSDPSARGRLLDWLRRRGMTEIPDHLAASDHTVAACAAALATWEWRKGTSPWLAPAEPPAHPFDFAG